MAIFISVKICFLTPQGLEFDTERSKLRSPSAARRSKGVARFQIHDRVGSKNRFSHEFNATTVSCTYCDICSFVSLLPDCEIVGVIRGVALI